MLARYVCHLPVNIKPIVREPFTIYFRIMKASSTIYDTLLQDQVTSPNKEGLA